MAEDCRQLKSGDPQRPESLGPQGDPHETAKNGNVDLHDMGLKAHEPMADGRNDKVRGKNPHDENGADLPLVATSANQRVQCD